MKGGGGGRCRQRASGGRRRAGGGRRASGGSTVSQTQREGLGLVWSTTTTLYGSRGRSGPLGGPQGVLMVIPSQRVHRIR